MISGQGNKLQLGQLLIEQGILKHEQLEEALAYQSKIGNTMLLGEILQKLEMCTEEHIMAALAEAYDIPFARVSPRVADPRIIEVLPREFLERHAVLPLFRVRKQLALAVNDARLILGTVLRRALDAAPTTTDAALLIETDRTVRLLKEVLEGLDRLSGLL